MQLGNRTKDLQRKLEFTFFYHLRNTTKEIPRMKIGKGPNHVLRKCVEC